MLDLHVHVLPGIDDGPRTLEDALALARALAEDGIEHIVATPHIYPGVFDNTAARIGEVFDEFQTAVSEAGIPLTMTWAAEVRICPEILEWIELRRLPMLNGSLVGPSTALIELPDGQIPVGTDKLMGLMLERGITPLVAHPERNKAVMEQPSRLEALRRLGCKFQLTAGSVLGDFGSRAQTTALKLLEAGWIDVIATDAHNRSSRKPRMGAARDWLAQQFDEALALRLTTTHPTEIAGVSSFAVQSGAQRLVFRDLPASAVPLDTTDEWSVDLLLGPDTLSAPHAPAAPTTADSSEGRWSLIDFRIDALVDDLNSVSLQQDQPAAPGSLDAEPTPFSAPATASKQPEDWLLPTFFGTPAAAPVTPPPVRQPVVTAVPTTEPTAPAIVQPTPPAEVVRMHAPKPTVVAPAVVEAAPAVETPVEVEHAMAAATVFAATPVASVKGLRLSELAPKALSTETSEPMQRPVQAAARAGSMAKAGHQAVNPAGGFPSTVRTAPRAPVERTTSVPTPEGVLRGFRLSDLNPLPTRRR